ncbi:hypothetical protein OOT00_09505 [Desulfobotulus sp. H1]|uniref:Uncharacterized protein n=1 Tax=Desulfobotulus pelophilus TaxID=2823377 RepID=A0ABT3N9T0_9BACT|nr:hypothetical protein [Desulfobotulus pelophilus]MCW7754222.1 hypothetical protein [Desulfobotulus pelophilus]
MKTGFLPSNFRLSAYLLATLWFAFMACTGPASSVSSLDPSAETALIRLQGKTATFAGALTEENLKAFLRAVDGKNISKLIIASAGGEVNAGMTMGEWVFVNQVDVAVERMCMSSCANYIFTAGVQKTIHKDSIVGWHGNVHQTIKESDTSIRTAIMETYEQLPKEQKDRMDITLIIEQEIRQAQEYFTQSLEREKRFFTSIGVDEYLCRIGNQEYGAEDFFLLSIQDMMRFGVTGVKAPDGYETTDLAPFRKTGKSVEFIRID